MYTHNYGNFTVVNFTIILIAAHKLVFTELKTSIWFPFPYTSQTSSELLFNDHLKKYNHLPI